MSDVLDRLKSALADRYAVERELGSGGMAIVYLARDLRHERDVAVKVLRAELAAAMGADRFLREIKLTAKLNHPHILPLLDSGEADGFLYYVMPYVAGESLRQRLERETQLPVDEALRITQQVAVALEFAHRQDVIHRDIKPANVLLHEGEAMVADFGIALAVSAAGGERLTETGVSVGTAEYMSPEQALGEGEPDARSDIYSLGCVLYEMLVGEPPYTGPTGMAVLAKRLSDPVPSARRLRAAIPVPVDAALVRALAKERADRFGGAREFVEALVAAAGADAGAVKSIAVLPFANLSAEPENEYFSDGITFDIISHLAKISDLKVVSRTSIMRYKTTDKPLRRIGEELGVAAIVEGEVQRVGDRVRIGAQLVDARTDEHLWAEQYDRELLDVFAIQSDVAHRVADALKATLTTAEKERIERRPTHDSEAYNLYLKGRYFFDRRGEGLWKGLEYFQQALEIDPDYALAHAGVADCYALLGFYGNLPAREAWPRAKAAALRALEIDEGLAEAHCSLGFAGLYHDWDPLAAEKHLQRAIEVNPGYAPAHYWYACVFAALGRLEDALSENRRALEVDPLSIFANVHYGWIMVTAGRQYERGREQLKRSLELDPNLAIAHWLLGQAYGMESIFEDGISCFKKAVELSDGLPWFLGSLGWAYGASGQAEEAGEVLSELDTRRRERYVRSLSFALVHIGLGDLDEALDWLEKAYEERDTYLVHLNIEPTFDCLRSHPRFIALLNKVGL